MTSVYDSGLQVRKQVLGEEHVEAALEKAGDFAAPFQNLVTEYCWGAVWGREGLDHRTRSLVNLGMLSAMGRMKELKTHIRGALRNGATAEEIREVLLQVTVYCGAPAGGEAFATAREVLQDEAELRQSAERTAQ